MSREPSAAQQAVGDIAPTEHLAFYAGWPNAMGAVGRLEAILADAGQADGNRDDQGDTRHGRP
ncbi:hypothetical protein ACGFY8_26555 [Streptomyces sp. NPDC048232]|uniref:hypothetical protein n=1 Tax=Streptomyces sp. NPDC048232 TaxID=3365520 RepID=UPI0037133F54